MNALVEVSDRLREGLALHQAGRLGEADVVYREVLDVVPEHPDALHLAGMVAHAWGEHGRAAALLRRATAASPHVADFHANLGHVLLAGGDLAGAAKSYERALRLRPEAADLRCNLAFVLLGLGRTRAAERHARRSVRERPDLAAAHVNLGNALKALGRVAEAEAAYRAAVACQPQLVEAHRNLAIVLWAGGRAAEAAASWRRVLALRSDDADGENELGVALTACGELTEALACFDRALALAPAHARAWTNRGNAFARLGDHEAAARSHERATTLAPDLAEAWTNLAHSRLVRGELGAARAACECALALRPDLAEAQFSLASVLADEGHLSEAIAACRRGVEADPANAEAHANLVFMLDLDPGQTPASCFAERRRWNARHARPLRAAWAPHTNVPDPDRRLRVGYVSADFKQHSAAWVVAPVFFGHDRGAFDVVAYSGVLQPDEVTERFEKSATLWRRACGMSGEALAAAIRADGIDILVDLSGFSFGNRLKVFARKPAPVQVTGWGHAVGTGLDAMDAFFADSVAVPPEARRWFTEKVVNLPSIVCYPPPPEAPDVAPSPVAAGAPFTFGCFNRVAKLSDAVLALWAVILAAAPGTRLLLKFTGLDSAASQERLRAPFVARGIDPARLLFLGGSGQRDHLAAYARVDLALDPFPHGGGVTALEGLWMGVPPVTLLGERVPGRLGASFLTTLGLPGLIAATREEYVALAVAHARRPDDLVALRGALRARMAASPLGDQQAYCRAVEDAYRRLWRRWCETKQHKGETR